MLVVLIVLCISLFICFYYLFDLLVGMPSLQYHKYLNAIRKATGTRTSAKIKKFLQEILTRIIKLSPDKREQLITAFSRCNIEMTPEEYYIRAISLSALVFLSSVLFIAIGFPIAAFGSLILSVLVYFQQIQRIQKDLEKINRMILDEMPGFIRSFSYGLRSSRDTISIIEKYRAIAKPALAAELDILIANLKTENYEEALKKFDARLNLDPVSAFVSGIIGISRGIDYRTYFYLLEENMKTLSRESLKREVAKRPGKLKKSIIITIIFLFLLYIVPVIIQLKDGFNLFK